MIDFREALGKIRAHTPILAPEARPLHESLGHVLAEAVEAPEPVPRFDSSAMDGFAVRVTDVAEASEQDPVLLPLQAEVRPGHPSPPVLQPGKAIRIFTGSPLPEGTEAVVMKEYVEEEARAIRVKRAPRAGDHVRKRGGEFSEGTLIFTPGTLLTPPMVGMLAGLGCTRIQVHPKPSVSIVLTGDEVRPPDAQVGPSQIRDANSPSLSSALEAMGIPSREVFYSRDDVEAVHDALSQALEGSNVVLSVGGVSVGKYDFVKDALKRLDVETLFWRIAMKPGKPNFFGRRGETLLFGLPGNAVSALISFYLLVRPALRAMQGVIEEESRTLRARLLEDLNKKDPRLEFVRGRISHGKELEVRPRPGRDSHMLGSLALADCLILFPKEREHMAAGEFVEIEPLKWSDL